MTEFYKFSNKLIGDWVGTVKTFFEPNKLADESPIQGTFTFIVNKLFLEHKYQGSLQGKQISF